MSKNIESDKVKYMMKSIMTDLEDAMRNSGKKIEDFAFSSGVSTNQIHRYFSGKAVIPFDRFIAIVDEAGIDMAFILGDESKKCFTSNSDNKCELQVELMNLRMQIEKELDGYSIEEKMRYVNYLSEIMSIISKQSC